MFDFIFKLTQKLYPTGRAFRMLYNGALERLHLGLAESEEKLYNDAISTLNSILPDNNNFTADDAADWERRLGMITNTGVSLSDRKKAIERKLNHPGTISARQNYHYLEGQLQAAGFDVYVYENRFPDGSGGYTTKTPTELNVLYAAFTIQHGEPLQMGMLQHGPCYTNKIVNQIDTLKDDYFNTGDNFRSTFFICGSTIGTFANVPAARKDEFRQLILKIKPAQTVGYLFVNYI